MNFFLYYILPLVFVLGVLILFHELGHFLVAKYFGVKVLKFSLGFGPKVAGKTIGETEYLLSLIPFGGYVKMLGESEDDDTKPLTPEEEKRSFSNQHVLKRIAIVTAGPFANLLLALIIFCIFYMLAGTQVMEAEIGQVREDSPAHKAGLLKGDVIVSIDGKTIEAWEEIKDAVQYSAGKSLEITILRGDSFHTMTVVPEASVIKNIFGEEVKSALIGIVASGKYKTVMLDPLGAVKQGFLRTWEITELTCLVVIKLLQGVVPIKTVGGPILIGQMTGQLAQESLVILFPFMAFISVNLGILNLLPIPILDGGFIIFLLIELIIGKPLSIKKRDLAQKVGLFLLITLMVVVMYNDIVRLFE
jgi:regulator of sigma E protease